MPDSLPPDRSVFGGWTALTTTSGLRVHLEVQYPELVLAVDRGPDPVARVAIPYPRAGYGGHELLLSPDERHLALWLYSGQSEVGYELFSFAPALAHRASFPYVRGEGLGPAFSADSSNLALAWSTAPGLYLDEHELDDEGLTVRESVVEWARIHVRALDGALDARECRVEVRLPAGFPFEGDDRYYPERLELLPDAARFETTWGATVRAPLPLPSAIVVEGPRGR